MEDVKDEIFDMVKPAHPTIITLADLVNCKVGDTAVGMLSPHPHPHPSSSPSPAPSPAPFPQVGDTVVGMLSDMHAFAAYDRREQSMDHSGGEES